MMCETQDGANTALKQTKVEVSCGSLRNSQLVLQLVIKLANTKQRVKLERNVRDILEAAFQILAHFVDVVPL